LTPGVEAGAYFFLRNDLGWRIVSTDEDQTVNYSGNLVGEDNATTLVNVTAGRSVLHLGLQPVTQRVDEILELNQDSQYGGTVTIDTISGTPGTVYPAGTPTSPVDTWADAVVIAASKNIESFYLRHAISFGAGDTLDDYIFLGANALESIITFAGTSVDNVELTNISVTGTMGAGYTVQKQGTAENVSNWEGVMFQVAINGTITLAASPSYAGSRRIAFYQCFSDVPGTGRPTLNCNGTTSDIQFRDYNGGLTVTNFTSGNSMTIDVNAATIEIAASCTAGTIVVRGVGVLNDLSGGGCTVISDGLVYGEAVNLARDHSRATNAQTQIA
jgi:hypothetical protein